MKRYIRIYWMIIKINFSAIFAYRANFYNSILITLGWGVVSISGIFIITAKISHIYSWSREELYLLTGLFSIIIGIFHMLFSSSMERFGRTISLGELDSYLLAPIDTQLYLSTRMFRPISVLRIMIGSIFTFIVIQQLHITLTFSTVFLLCLFLFCSVLLLYSLWFLVVTLMIWNPNLTNLIDFLFIFNSLGRYPSSMITSAKNIFLYIVLPFALVASVPASFLLGKVHVWEVIVLILSSIILFVLSRLFWKYALTFYSSASS